MEGRGGEGGGGEGKGLLRSQELCWAAQGLTSHHLQDLKAWRVATSITSKQGTRHGKKLQQLMASLATCSLVDARYEPSRLTVRYQDRHVSQADRLSVHTVLASEKQS